MMRAGRRTGPRAAQQPVYATRGPTLLDRAKDRVTGLFDDVKQGAFLPKSEREKHEAEEAEVGLVSADINAAVSDWDTKIDRERRRRQQVMAIIAERFKLNPNANVAREKRELAAIDRRLQVHEQSQRAFSGMSERIDSEQNRQRTLDLINRGSGALATISKNANGSDLDVAEVTDIFDEQMGESLQREDDFIEGFTVLDRMDERIGPAGTSVDDEIAQMREAAQNGPARGSLLDLPPVPREPLPSMSSAASYVAAQSRAPMAMTTEGDLYDMEQDWLK